MTDAFCAMISRCRIEYSDRPPARCSLHRRACQPCQRLLSFCSNRVLHRVS